MDCLTPLRGCDEYPLRLGLHMDCLTCVYPMCVPVRSGGFQQSLDRSGPLWQNAVNFLEKTSPTIHKVVHIFPAGMSYPQWQAKIASSDHNPRFDWRNHGLPFYRRHMNEQNNYKPIAAQSLGESQRQVWGACRMLKDGGRLYGVVSHESAIAFLGVEIPESCLLLNRHSSREPVVHVTVSDKSHRRRGFRAIQSHVWGGLLPKHVRYTKDDIAILAPEPLWALMAGSLRVDALVELGESMIRHGRTTTERLRDFLGETAIRHRGKCEDALCLMESGSDSPKETQLRLCLYSYGLGRFSINYVVPNATFNNGLPMTLDLADPELLIGIEYDGDHHRTDRNQWRRDAWKRRQLESMGWTIVSATQLDLSDDAHRGALAMSIAMIRARKSGCPIALTTPLSWHALADRRRRLWRTVH